ncbi:unnamed protein product [Laminaria digitata]
MTSEGKGKAILLQRGRYRDVAGREANPAQNNVETIGESYSPAKAQISRRCWQKRTQRVNIETEGENSSYGSAIDGSPLSPQPAKTNSRPVPLLLCCALLCSARDMGVPPPPSPTLLRPKVSETFTARQGFGNVYYEARVRDGVLQPLLSRGAEALTRATSELLLCCGCDEQVSGGGWVGR